MSPAARHPVLVLGAGPGLGLSIARRFGREGHPVALVARNANHLPALRQEGIDGIAIAADIRDPGRLHAAIATVTRELGPVGVAYYGPGAADPASRPAPILRTGPAELREAMRSFADPAVELAAAVLPGMIERGTGTLLFVTGLGAIVALPGLGALAVASAAVRTYALSLNAALKGTGVYSGALIIGGLIEGGDIHRHAVAAVGPGEAGHLPTLDPDVIAGAAWDLSIRREPPEAVFDALGLS